MFMFIKAQRRKEQGYRNCLAQGHGRMGAENADQYNIFVVGGQNFWERVAAGED